MRELGAIHHHTLNCARLCTGEEVVEADMGENHLCLLRPSLRWH